MAINVYWSFIENEWMRAEEPKPLANSFYGGDLFSKSDSNLDMNKCSAFNSHMNNVFTLKSVYSYEFIVDKERVYSNDYDQAFFNRHVTIKSLDRRLFSFTQGYTFFTDSPSLLITSSEFPYLEDNEFTTRCNLLPGSMDIGKWYRNLDTMFYLKKGYDSFSIKEGDIYSYLRFHTKEKINFIQYRQTDLMNRYMLDCIRAKDNRKLPESINEYYSKFKIKPLILKEIKNNILDKN